MNIKVVIGSATLALLAIGAASAQGAMPKSSNSFASMDTNKDGHISKDEANDNYDLKGAFSKLDSNSDNMLSESEFAKYVDVRKQPSSTGPATDTATVPLGGTEK